MTTMPLVRPDDHGIRPAGPAGVCLYCRSKVGEPHGVDCVAVTKRVRLRLTVEYERDIPAFWGEEDLLFQHYDGSYCGDNALNDIQRYLERTGQCLCSEELCVLKLVRDVDSQPTAWSKGEKP